MLVVCCCAATLSAQEDNPEPSEPVSSDEEGVEDLFLATLEQDLATADESELLLWARDLGLSTQGSSDQIRQRILAYYGVTATSSSAREPTPAGRSFIRIETARRTAFENIAGEDTLRLTGGVDVQMVDDGVEHSIQADELILNLANDQLSARGDVTYVVTRADGVERFRGDLLVFQVGDWDGVFLRGFSQIESDEAPEEVDFSISGGRISRSPEEIIVIDGGSLTSSDADPPNYRIAARRIWLLAPGEWGLRSAVLYVGRVPTFYLPYFFIPGDRLFFHPSVGTRDREGTYVQTTTYIFGASEDADAPISLLRLAQTPDENDREREGLFLRIVEEPQQREPEDWRLRVLFDWYGRLGFYTAIDGQLPEFGGFETFDFNLGLARTRNIYNRNGFLTPYYDGPNGERLVHTNSGWFLGMELPLRYETALAFSGSTDQMSGSLDFRHFSDPQFVEDFEDRAESMDWGFVVSPGTEIDTDSTDVTLPTWSATAQYQPDVSELNPWVQSLSLEQINSSVTWRSKTNQNLPAASALSTVQSSPDAQFFYPTVATFPEVRFRANGRLVDLARQPTTPAEQQAEIPQARQDLRPPWTQEPQTEQEVPPQLRLPDPAADADGVRVGRSGNVTLDYSLAPILRVDHWYDDDAVTEPADVQFDRDYTTTEVRTDGQLLSSYTVFDDLLTAQANLDATQRYRVVQGGGDGLDSVRDSAATFTGVDSSQTSSLTFTPLTGLSLVYSVASDLWSYSLTNIDASGHPSYAWAQPEWDNDSVDRHEVRMNVAVEPAIGTQSLQLSADLPPLVQNYTGSASSEIGPLTSTLSGGFTEDSNGVLQPQDLQQGHRLTLNDLFGANSTITYDLESVVVSRLTGQVELGPLTAAINARRQQDAFFTAGVGWTTSGQERLRTETVSFALDASDRTFRYWRNRIAVQPILTASLTLNPIRPNQSTAALSYGLDLDVFRFLDLNFRARSENDTVYRYIPSYANELGVESRSFVNDVVDGFRFGDRDAREASSFNLVSLTIDAIHDLNDWELIVSYEGEPELDSTAAPQVFRWSSTLEIVLRWKPIEELSREIDFADGELTRVQ